MTREALYRGIDCDQGRRKEFLKRNKFKEIMEVWWKLSNAIISYYIEYFCNDKQSCIFV